ARQRGQLLRAALGFARCEMSSSIAPCTRTAPGSTPGPASGGSPWGWRTRSERLFGDGSDLAAYLPTRRDSRLDVCVSRASPNGGDNREKVPRHELLGGRG